MITVKENNLTNTPHYNIGDTVYLTKTIAVTEICPYCNGIGIVNDSYCPICNGKNTVNRTVHIPIPTPATIKEIKISIKEDKEIFRYVAVINNQKFNRVPENIFESFDSAIKYCKKNNTRKTYMKIDDIKISGSFRKTYPCAEKIEKRMQELRTTGKFENIIEVNEENVLIDGYTTYVLAKGLGWTEIEVLVHVE